MRSPPRLPTAPRVSARTRAHVGRGVASRTTSPPWQPVQGQSAPAATTPEAYAERTVRSPG
ncbi:hypothetical protein [Hymenobacter sublimis]|uniref:Uncharacterized protein n=1 Tax=Hymenobacter sublimis TaxID=2933777 RepID=A0ABY4JBK0_9BACT|nr:hypothetical protein [Hymenobacter sublimis]UPL50195.1 hypothetical protein MWH26_04625 [Hymenobacter sublimis]